MADFLAAQGALSLPSDGSWVAEAAVGSPHFGTQDIRRLVTTAVHELLGTGTVDGTAPLMAAGAHDAVLLLPIRLRTSASQKTLLTLCSVSIAEDAAHALFCRAQC